MKIKVQQNKIVAKEEKEKIINRNTEKALRVIQKTNVQNNILKKIKLNAEKGLNKKIEYIEYIEAFSIIVLLSNKFNMIKIELKDDPEKEQEILLNENYWYDPSEKHYIYFLYTYLYELYESYLKEHLDYFLNLSEKEMLNNLKDY